MNVHILFNRVLKTIKSNSPEIMTGLGVAGVITTSYLAGKAGYETCKAMSEEDPYMSLKERARHTWRLYIPAGISGAVTIACIIGASKSNGQRTTAAVAAYSLSEKAFSDYREKVVEQIGKNKEQAIRDDISQDKVKNNPVGSREVIVLGSGHVLCCELYTNRYFNSDMETLRKAVNTINHKITNHPYVTLDEFYDLIDIPHTSNSSSVGWDFDKLLDLDFSSVLTETGEPCLAFEYNYVKPLR